MRKFDMIEFSEKTHYHLRRKKKVKGEKQS